MSDRVSSQQNQVQPLANGTCPSGYSPITPEQNNVGDTTTRYETVCQQLSPQANFMDGVLRLFAGIQKPSTNAEAPLGNTSSSPSPTPVAPTSSSSGGEVNTH